jgi:ABC-type multidrug transport system fused ATPase/permease subunit
MDLRPLFAWMDRSAGHRTFLATFLFLGVLAIGAFDTVTGTNMSFGVFYVLLVVALTMVGGHRRVSPVPC